MEKIRENFPDENKVFVGSSNNLTGLKCGLFAGWARTQDDCYIT